MKRLFVIFSALVPSLALAALSPDIFRWSRTLEGEPVKQTTVAAVQLDAAIFAATADDYCDIRLLNDAGVEIPRSIEKLLAVQQHTVRRDVGSRLVAIKELSDNRIEAEFEVTSMNPATDGFTVATPLRDFQHSVKVETSADGAAWTTLVEAAPLFDYTRYMDLRQLDVKTPHTANRHFRLTISNITGDQAQPLTRLMTQTGGHDGSVETRTADFLKQTFRIDRVNFWREETVDGAAEEIRRDWPLKNFTVEPQKPKDTTTIITIQTGRLPLNRIILEIAENNFSRTVEVDAPTIRNGVADWSSITSTRILCVELPGFSRRELNLDLGEIRADRVRLVLRNESNPPLTIRSITGSGPTWRALFLAEPGRSYRMLYGNEQIPAPNYDLESVLAPARRGLKPAEWKLGEPVENKNFRPGSGAPLAWLNSTWTFGAAIALMLLVLGALLYRTAKRASQDSDESKN